MLRRLTFTVLSALCVMSTASALAEDVFSPLETSTLLEGSVTAALKNSVRLEVPDKTCAAPVQDAYGHSVALRILPKQIVKNAATNSELAVDFPYKEGDKIRYSWRMQIPDGFNADSQNRWWLVARWNDQANTKIGEKPEDFLGHNPAMMIGYKQMDNHDSLYLSYGVPDSVSSAPFSIPRGEWIKISVEVLWSRSDKGQVKLYVNNGKAPYREATGRNMFGKYHNLFRLGSYRSGDIQTDATVLYGDIKAERIN